MTPFNFKTMSWIGSKVKCDLCGHEWIAVFLAQCERLECPNCKNMTQFEFLEIDEDFENDTST
jgi:formate dehydrogenase maturation protein FdhE